VAILYGMNMTFPFLMLTATQIGLTLIGGALMWRVERRTRKLHAQKPASVEAIGTASATATAMVGDAAR
jgi:hypothetical protein